MPPGPPRAAIFGLLVCLCCLAGCASGEGVFRGGPASVGSLKTVINRLEFENEKLRREVADAQTERARLAERLTREEAANTDLTAQLDRIRDPLGTELVDRPSPRTAPANAPSRGRKPPFARISGGVEATAPLDEGPRHADDDPPALRRPVPSDPFGPQSRRRGSADDQRWLPVARDPKRVSR